MLAAIIQKQQKLHTFPSNTTNVKTDLHLPQQQTARIVQIVYSSDSRKKRENVGALQWNRLSNHIRKCFCFQLCQAADKGLYRTKCLQLSEHHRVVSNWNMGVHEVTHCAQLHWAPCPAQSTTFSKHTVRLERTSALCAEDKIECGNITFWGKTKNWTAAKSMRTLEEAPEKKGPWARAPSWFYCWAKPPPGCAGETLRNASGGSCNAAPSFATEANPDNKVSLKIYLSR